MGAGKTGRAGGFTLVEILTVIVIIGIAAIIVVPQIGSRDDLRASSSARVVVADLIYAQSLAIATHNMTYVKFDVAGDKYRVLTVASPTGDTIAKHPITKSDYVTSFGAGARGFETIKIDSAVFNGIDPNYQNEFTLAFDEMGTPHVYSYTADTTNDLKDGTIVLISGPFTRTITITPYTGEILVE